MKMRTNCKPISVGFPVNVSKIKGHTTITLKNVKTGEVERYEDDNMMTNALQEYFRNCGFLNYPNIDQDNMVESLLGGVLGLDSELSESASLIRVPAGVKMTFNGAVGVVNNGNPTEMGSYSSTESGWQQDGSYIQTYDFSTSQANGTIGCVCLTSKNYGFYGEGNATSLTRHATYTNIFNLAGTYTDYTINGTPFNIDTVNSSCHTFKIETVGNDKVGVIRKYRIPFSTVNIKGTKTAPIELSRTEIAIDSDLKSASTRTNMNNGNLLIWNTQPSYVTAQKWGEGWTQYLWTITPSGTITKQTVLNTSGVDLYGLQAAWFDGNYCFFIAARNNYIDSRIVYVWNRTTNAITSINNPYGIQVGSVWESNFANTGWNIVHGSGDGRIVTQGSSYGVVVDAVLGACYPTNNSSTEEYHFPTGVGLLNYSPLGALRLLRDQTYIATINNLATPIVKTSEKTMKVVYRITFDEEEGTSTSS